MAAIRNWPLSGTVRRGVPKFYGRQLAADETPNLGRRMLGRRQDRADVAFHRARVSRRSGLSDDEKIARDRKSGATQRAARARAWWLIRIYLDDKMRPCRT